MSQIVLEAKRVSYIYRTRHRTVQALNEVSYCFESGKVYAIVGKSGCGKSTLISVLAGLYLPSMGHVLCHGKDTLTLDRTLHRRHDVAVIYQNYNLFPLMTVMENVLYPLSLQRKKKKEARKPCNELRSEYAEADRRLSRLVFRSRCIRRDRI